MTCCICLTSRPLEADITPAELACHLASAGVRILDVRTTAEFAGEHIEGALNIPLGELDARIDELSPTVEYAIVCRSGARAVSAGQLLARRGMRFRVMQGGLLEWRRAGLPVQGGR